MADETLIETSEPSRSERMARARKAWKARIIGIAVIVAIAAAAGGAFAWRASRAKLVAPPQYVIVIGESMLEDGTKTAGAVAVVRRTGSGYEVEAVDTAQKRQIPGTSYDQLREALAMGGPKLVARIVAKDIDGAEEPAWLLLEQEAWAGAIQDAGGVTVSLDESSTAFTGESLYRFVSGPNRLSGDAATALLLATESFEDAEKGREVRELLGKELGESVVARPGSVESALDEGLGEYSGLREQLGNFLHR